jgi:hypothetical protein
VSNFAAGAAIAVLLFGTLFAWNNAGAAEHPLGMPRIVFCDAFLKQVAQKMPMSYAKFIKRTDGEGMPVSSDRRHWDGLKSSYLTVEIHLNLVKGGIVTCPNGETKPFGVWDSP